MYLNVRDLLYKMGKIITNVDARTGIKLSIIFLPVEDKIDFFCRNKNF